MAEQVTAPPAAAAGHGAGLDDYAPIIGEQEVGAIRVLARGLAGRAAKMVNSTAVGGGVAEILNRLVPLLEETGVPTQWEVIKGGEQFFAVTKSFHNALHGAPYDGNSSAFQAFLATNEENRQHMKFDEDFILIHDPQPVALVEARNGSRGRWAWRCHIDLSHANRQVWEFLEPFVRRYDAAIFSSPAFTQGLAIPQYLMYPTIDPLSDKNRELGADFVADVLEQFRIDASRPILTQISRFDRLKDPVGVVQAYRMVKRYDDCQLVLAGGSADDDPEGAAVLREVEEAAAGDPDVHILNLPPWSHKEINALQRASTIVVQKSLREGFGLTVAEALWKKKPVVASAVGGIPAQIHHKLTGVLVHSVEGCAYQIRYLLSNPGFARKLGETGHEHVKRNFLIPHSVKRALLLFHLLAQPSS